MKTTLLGMMILLTGLLAVAQTNRPPRAATPAPKFVLRDLDKKVVKLADFEGQGLLVVFLLTAADLCQQQLPALVELQRQYGGAEFTVVGLLLDDKPPSALKEYISTNQVNFPVLLADYDAIQGFGGLTAVPTIFVVEPQHLIVQHFVGVTDKATLEAEIKHLLKK